MCKTIQKKGRRDFYKRNKQGTISLLVFILLSLEIQD